jgi:hypothetical protein
MSTGVYGPGKLNVQGIRFTEVYLVDRYHCNFRDSGNSVRIKNRNKLQKTLAEILSIYLLLVDTY